MIMIVRVITDIGSSIYLIIYLSTCDFICDALHDFGSNAYKRHSNGWPKHRSN